ncbi:5451_t:CDS:2 [Racocetra fulgida]|uniref:5451_t:CDS:1 n=1 Tax=Racocetra fulgida TaxID=60492 RepID=A0A9N8W8J4_9GLOM|nr:5451_t:CDS:2 [Racocetra fulgida]
METSLCHDLFIEELKNLYKEIDHLSRYKIEKIEIVNSIYDSFSIEHREDIRKAIINANIRLLNKNENYLFELEIYTLGEEEDCTNFASQFLFKGDFSN